MTSPTAVREHAADVVVLSTGDVRIPVHPTRPAVGPGAADQPYLPPAGGADLRAAVARQASSAGAPVAPGQVLITPGARVALLTVLGTVLAGDRREVLLPTPYWPSYPRLVALAGGVPRPVPGAVGGHPDPELLERHRTAGTAAVLVNSPRNPDGAVVPAGTLRALLDWSGRHGVTLVADEVYRGVPGTVAPSVLECAGELPEHCVLVDGLTKSHALAGLRVGWAIAAPGPAARLAGTASHLYGHTSGIAQEVALAAFGRSDRSAWAAVLDGNRRRALACLAALPGVDCTVPPGGIFLFPDLRGSAGAPRADVVGWLRDRHRVAVVDGAPFGAPGHVRLSVAVPPELLDEGLRRLAAALSGAAG